MQDEVYVQVLDLDKEYRVCTADIYYHKLCLASYLKKFDCLETIEDRTRTGSQKRMFFLEEIDSIQVLLDRGFALL